MKGGNGLLDLVAFFSQVVEYCLDVHGGDCSVESTAGGARPLRRDHAHTYVPADRLKRIGVRCNVVSRNQTRYWERLA